MRRTGRTMPIVGMSTVCILALAATAGAGTCYLDDPLKLTALTSPIQAGGTGDDFAGDDLCGHTVAGSSCVLEVNVDSEGTELDDCLTLLEGVTVEMNGHTIDCPSGEEPCGSAIAADSDTTNSKKVVLEDGNILGCWTTGVEAFLTSDGLEIKDFFIDLAANTSADCYVSAYNVGVQGDGVKKMVRTVVADAGSCATSIQLVQDSLLKDCAIGVTGGSGVEIDNSVLVNHTNGIIAAAAAGDVDFRNSTVTGSSSCNLFDGVSCQDSDPEAVVDLLGSLNIVGCTIHD